MLIKLGLCSQNYNGCFQALNSNLAAADEGGMAKNTVFDELLESPWWMSLAMAASIYVILNFILPNLHIEHFILSPLASSAGVIGKPIVYLLVFISALSGAKHLFTQKRSRSIHKQQTDIGTVRDLSWDDFEQLTGQAYRKQGYRVIENNKKGPDGGIDLVLKRNGETTLVQCKHWKTNKIGVPVIRELLGVVTAEKADHGIVVGTGKFTEPALKFAQSNNIEIVDDTKLIEMLEAQLPTFTNKEIESPYSVPGIDCPSCDGQMVKRIAKRGKNPGSEFLGCSSFPKCRATMPL